MREEEKERLLGLYQYLHSRAHNSSRPLKNIYFTGPRENLLAWVRAVFSVWVTPTLRPRVAEQGWWHKAAPALCSPGQPQTHACSFRGFLCQGAAGQPLRVPCCHPVPCLGAPGPAHGGPCGTSPLQGCAGACPSPFLHPGHQRLRALHMLQSPGHQGGRHQRCQQAHEVDPQGGRPTLHPHAPDVLTGISQGTEPTGAPRCRAARPLGRHGLGAGGEGTVGPREHGETHPWDCEPWVWEMG